MKFELLGKGLLLSAIVSALLVAAPGDVKALSFDFGNDVVLDADVTLTYGAAWRTKNADKDYLTDINADDGNRNFDKGDLINNRFTVIADIDLHKGDYGAFVRPKAYFDYAYDGDNSNDSPGTNNNSFENGGSTPYDEFTKDTQDAHRDKAEILDAFVYGAEQIGDYDAMLRIGQQAVNWGESLFLLQGINGATAYLDTTQANVPGVEVKELLLPTQQVYGEVTRGNTTLAGFYQWQWEKNRLDEAGSFFSTTDYLDEAGERQLLEVAPGVNATIDRAGDEDAKDSGQWGVAVRYNVEALNDTEFGIYYVNYHEKMPLVREHFGAGGDASPTQAALGGDWGNLPVAPGVSLGMADPGNAGLLNLVDASAYSLEYVENVKLIGASISGIVGETNVAGEVSYRDDMPIPFADASSPLLGFSYEKSDYVQAQVSAIRLFPASFLYDGLTVTAEVGALRILDNKELQAKHDQSSFGGVFKFAFDYFQIMQKLDLQVPVTFKYNPKGTSPILGTFDEDKDSIAVGLDFTYNGEYKLSLAYTEFLHDYENNPLADRDFFAASFKYTF